jgi:hypothetical protein
MAGYPGAQSFADVETLLALLADIFSGENE